MAPARFLLFSILAVCAFSAVFSRPQFDVDESGATLVKTSDGEAAVRSSRQVDQKAHPETAAVEYVEQPTALLRKNVNKLTLAEAFNLKTALRKLQQDQGPGGLKAIARFHGAPFICPGMPFLQWNRLLIVQFEQALKQHGSTVGIPYWDWTVPEVALPSFLNDTGDDNPFSGYFINFAGQKTTRSPLETLFTRADTLYGQTIPYGLTLDALEEEDFCRFEVSLEFLHNRIHFFLGDPGNYSTSTVDYSAFVPLDMVIHSNLDRIWASWQLLQIQRNNPYTAVHCGGFSFHTPLRHLDTRTVNTIALTQSHAVPDTITDHTGLDYEYDNYDIRGLDIDHVMEEIKKRKSHTRIYYGEAANGVGPSAAYEVSIVNDEGERFAAGAGYTLGSSKEMPCTNEILFRYDVTEAIDKSGVAVDKPVKFFWVTRTYNNQVIEEYSDYGIVVVKEANSDHLLLNIPVGAERYPISPKLIIPKGSQVRFLPVSEKYNYPIEKMVSLANLNRCAIPPFAFDSYALNVVHDLQPGHYYFVSSNKTMCESGKRFYIVVEDH